MHVEHLSKKLDEIKYARLDEKLKVSIDLFKKFKIKNIDGRVFHTLSGVIIAEYIEQRNEFHLLNVIVNNCNVLTSDIKYLSHHILCLPKNTTIIISNDYWKIRWNPMKSLNNTLT